MASNLFNKLTENLAGRLGSGTENTSYSNQEAPRRQDENTATGGHNARDNFDTRENVMSGSSGRTNEFADHQSRSTGGLRTGSLDTDNTNITANDYNSRGTTNTNDTRYDTRSGRTTRGSGAGLASGLSAGAGPTATGSKPARNTRKSISGIDDPRDAPTNSVDVGPPDAALQPPSVMRQHLGTPAIAHDHPEDSTVRRHSVSDQEKHFMR